jgi:hypothetical protein
MTTTLMTMLRDKSLKHYIKVINIFSVISNHPKHVRTKLMSVPLAIGVMKKPLQQPHILLVEVFQTNKMGSWIENHDIKLNAILPNLNDPIH